jgi:hypothetical protein
MDWNDPDANALDHAMALQDFAHIWLPQLEANITMSGSAWELLSHTVTIEATGAILSILARRPREA